jgi:hypothetical protein
VAHNPHRGKILLASAETYRGMLRNQLNSWRLVALKNAPCSPYAVSANSLTAVPARRTDERTWPAVDAYAVFGRLFSPPTRSVSLWQHPSECMWWLRLWCPGYGYSYYRPTYAYAYAAPAYYARPAYAYYAPRYCARGWGYGPRAYYGWRAGRRW